MLVTFSDNREQILELNDVKEGDICDRLLAFGGKAGSA
jgi:hypothetical protein